MINSSDLTIWGECSKDMSSSAVFIWTRRMPVPEQHAAFKISVTIVTRGA